MPEQSERTTKLTKDYYVVPFHTLPEHICSAFLTVDRVIDVPPRDGEVWELDMYTSIDPSVFGERYFDFEKPCALDSLKSALQTIKTYFEGYDPNEVLIWFKW